PYPPLLHISLLLLLPPPPHPRHLHSFPTRRSSDLWFPQFGHGAAAVSKAPPGVRARLNSTGAERRLQALLPPGRDVAAAGPRYRSEEHTSELQSRFDLVCRLLLEKKKKKKTKT